MSDHYDETAHRLGKPIAAFGGRGMKRLIVTCAGVGLIGVAYEMFAHPKPGLATLVSILVVMAAVAFLVWRSKSVARGFTVCRHGLLLKEQIRETEYTWDEISHVIFGKSSDPNQRTVAVVLIDGKSINEALTPEARRRRSRASAFHASATPSTTRRQSGSASSSAAP